jgi:hypothetical protein
MARGSHAIQGHHVTNEATYLERSTHHYKVLFYLVANISLFSKK